MSQPDLFDGDRALLAAFRAGERRALRRVYDAHVHDVAALMRGGFVLRGPQPRYVPGVRDPEREMDLVQEVFTKAFSERARLAYDGLRPYRPFLLATTSRRPGMLGSSRCATPTTTRFATMTCCAVPATEPRC